MWFPTLFLFILGTCFGSFASVVIYRLKSGKKGAIFGESECGYCGKTLSWKELIPIFSYFFQKGKCAGCGKKLSAVYPVLEIVSGSLFVISGTLFCDLPLAISGDTGEIARLAFFLAVSLVSVITAFYDFLYMEIPDEILLPSILAIGLLLGFLPENTQLFRHFADVSFASFPSPEALSNLANAAFGAAGIYTFFYLQFLVPAFWHCMKHRKYRDALTVVSYYVFLPFAVFFELFKPTVRANQENEEELPTWIGLWDLRIAVFMGFVAGAKIAALGVFIAYLIGSVVGTYVLTVRKERNVAVPFGPFLIAGLFSSLLWYEDIVPFVFSTSFY